MYDLVLRITDSVSVFDHEVTVTCLQSMPALTRYTCPYGDGQQRYTHVQLPGQRYPPSSQYRVMTINTWNFNQWQSRLPLLKQILDQYEPDLVAFQEVVGCV